MTLTSVKEGDIVEVNKKGRVFLARVEAKQKGCVEIRPLHGNINYFEASAREIITHWRKARRNGTS